MSDAQEHREAAEQYETRVKGVRANRPHGVTLARLDGSHAIRTHGDQVIVVHYEGVSRRISPDGFFTGFFLDDTMKWTYKDMMAKLLDPETERVDLADFVKVFGARCESNFHTQYNFFTEGNND